MRVCASPSLTFFSRFNRFIHRSAPIRDIFSCARVFYVFLAFANLLRYLFSFILRNLFRLDQLGRALHVRAGSASITRDRTAVREQ